MLKPTTPGSKQEKTDGRRPYVLTDALARFNQRNTAFARAGWDKTSAAYGAPHRSAAELEASGKAGYSVQDLALHAGAWAMAHRTPGPPAADAACEPEEKATDDSCRDEPHAPEDWTDATRRLKRAARLYGASLVGIARVNPLWLYACNGEERPIELPEGVETAVVIAVAMDYELTRASPAVIAAAATGNGYSRMDFVTNCVAGYLRDLGWRALPSGNDMALSVPLAIDAGLGELGRNGILITAPHGPRVRLCKVFTDAPLEPDAPAPFGVREFCDVCMKCADTCPSKSITRDPMTDAGPTPSNNSGARKWYVNPDKCLAFWRANGASCSNCIRSCPFNKPPGILHAFARSVVKARSTLADRALVALDDLCGYGKQKVPHPPK